MFLPNALIIAARVVVGVERSMERNFAAPGVLEVVLQTVKASFNI